MRISDWSSDVCSSDLQLITCHSQRLVERLTQLLHDGADTVLPAGRHAKRMQPERHGGARQLVQMIMQIPQEGIEVLLDPLRRPAQILVQMCIHGGGSDLLAYLQAHHAFVQLLERSEEHTSELQSLMRISYAVFCLK